MAYYGGNQYNNWYRGTNGNDVFSLLAGNDTAYGGNGDDVFYAHSGNDRLYGEGGNDTLDGGDGYDYIDGGSGHDVLYAGDDKVADTLVGGTGNDVYWINTFLDEGWRNDRIVEYAGGGIDTAIVKGSYTLDAHVENMILQDVPFSQRFAATFNHGNELDNAITGNSFANSLQGMEGNDTLDGGAGNDTLIGGLGNETLFGSTGDDFFLLDSGNDVANGGDGFDHFTLGYAGIDGVAEMRNHVIMDFQPGIDQFTNADPWVFTGSTGDLGQTTLVFSNGEDNCTVRLDGIAHDIFQQHQAGGTLGSWGIALG
ncbi:hypothetical protein [Azospirillum argentinense]|uniref:calcium-binding protein n=1 Tax=Azospirillum argentinense TaxID=2970906 RepID=UPI0032DF506C